MWDWRGVKGVTELVVRELVLGGDGGGVSLMDSRHPHREVLPEG